MQLSRRHNWRGREVAWATSGAGPAVVFCHGTPWSSLLWVPFAQALASRHTVYVWDMPGYGQSSMDADHPVDLGVQGELFADLLTAWRLTRPHAVAHDYGGAVALRAHLLHHVQFASLCLVDVVALRPWGSPYFMLVKEHAGVFSRLPAAVHRGALEAYIATASHRGLRPEQMNDLTRPWLGEPGQSAFYRQIAQADERFTDEFESRLGSISVPVHVIWGGEDTWIPVRQGERLHRAIPGSTLSVIPDAGHLIHYDAPVALADQLATWLTARSHR